MAKTLTVTTVRSSQGIRDMLFEELDRLRAGEVNPQRVNVIAKTAGQIISTVRLEMDFARLSSGLGKQGLGPVALG